LSQNPSLFRLTDTNKQIRLKTFEEIYADNYTRLYRLAVRMVDDRESASDIVQEVFMTLYEKLSGGTSVMYLNTWLYRVTINKCMDFLNGRKRYHSIEEIEDIPADEISPESTDKQRFVRLALARMKPTERVLLVMYSEGFSYKEISDSTGIRFTSVGKTLARSLVKMEQQLKSQGYETY
jgi:RNA polymerase sigma-70 factor, ECF subfamily